MKFIDVADEANGCFKDKRKDDQVCDRDRNSWIFNKANVKRGKIITSLVYYIVYSLMINKDNI